MHLKQIKMAGFKSFADPQDLTVMAGLTGIVGPNGCGKSNLLEALRWVMGASSARAMRGQAMDDLIFSGSGSRAARELAEVSLVLDNTSRTAPPAYNDFDSLEITRRIKRGAGSSFSVNGRPARAKDVRLVFADASTGANSPSLVRQGQISELISARPENRRRILEEAAGISGLNTRRHEAELKLKSAEANLERCHDIEIEITRQLASLKRQASKAESYRLLTEEMQALGLYIAANVWQLQAASEAQAKLNLDAALRATTEAEQGEARAETQRLEASASLAPLRQSASIAGAKLGQVRIEHAKIEAQLSASTDAQAAQKREEYRLREDLTILTEQIAELTEKQADLQVWLEDNPPLDDAAFRQKTHAIREEKNQIQDVIFDMETDINILRDKRAKLQAEQAASEAQTRAMRERFQRSEAALTRAQSEKDALPSLSDNEAKTTTAGAALATLGDEVKSLGEAKTQAEAENTAAEIAQRSAGEVMADRRNDLQGLKAQWRGVSDILAATTHANTKPVLNDMDVDEGYEPAVASVLGDDLQGSLDTTSPLHWRKSFDTGVALPADCVSLSRFVRGPAQLSSRLSQCGVVETVAAGEKLSKVLQQGQRLVTKAGHMWRWDGFTRFPDAPQKSAETLKLVRRKQALDSAIDIAQTALDLAQHEMETRATVAAKAKSHFDAIQAQLATTTAHHAKNLNILERAKLEGESLQARHALADSRMSAALGERGEAQGVLDAFQQSLTDLNMDDTQPQIDQMLQDLQGLRQKERAAEIEEAEATRAFASAQNIYAQNQQDADKTDIRLDSAKTRITRVQKSLQDVREKIALSDSAPEALQARFSALVGQIATLEAERQSTGDALARAEATYGKLALAVKQNASEAATAREATIKARLVHEAALAKRVEAESLIAERFDLDPKDLDISTLDANAEKHDWPHSVEALKAHEIKLTASRERLGGVNMDAATEAQDLASRAQTHADERADLEAAIGTLREAIKTLNDKGRLKLTAAYEAVNGHFKMLFTRLFGGGQAELKLVNADDPLAAGLEIYAQPPGKKLATLALMSGGEQALTATALIFAVFLTQPSPICVLDEVDAPLDDANVTRFCDLLDSMRQQTETRFLVITHNPVTMSRMDRLFGVTMREKGVSKLVSVDLQTANEMIA